MENMRKKLENVRKDKVKIYILASLIVSLIFLVISYFVAKIPENATFFYENNEIVSRSWHDSYLDVAATIDVTIFLLAIALTVWLVVDKIRMRAKIAAKIGGIWLVEIICFFIFMMAYIFIDGLWDESDFDPVYYEFSDGNHTIVVREESFLLYGGARIFQIMDDNRAVVIGALVTDDGARNNGNYDIVWSDSYVEITYHTFNGNKVSAETKRYEFVE